MSDPAPWSGWAIVELLGHRRVLGHLTEATIAGASFLRVETLDDPPIVQFYAPGSVYCITPTTEEIVRRHAPRPPVALRRIPNEELDELDEDDEEEDDDEADDDDLEIDEDLDVTPEWTI
jgi:hypothetical protein